MKSDKGPPLAPASRAGILPIRKSEVSAEMLRKYSSDVPLRRPAVQPRIPVEEPLQVAESTVNEVIAAIANGSAIEVHADGAELTVKMPPEIRDTIQAAGLSADQMTRFLDHLANSLRSADAIAKLSRPTRTLGLQEYQTILGRGRVAYRFRLVLAVLPESASVVIVMGDVCRIPI